MFSQSPKQQDRKDFPCKTLVIGRESFLGKHMLKAYQAFYPDTLATHYKSLHTRTRIDLSSPNLNDLEIVPGEYGYAFIAAANTNLSLCEEERGVSFRKNVEGILRLAEQLVQLKIKPILLSSDYVFDGVLGGYTEESKTSPINEYGRQKERMEQKIQEICGDNYLIVRCSKVFGLERGDGTLFDQIISPLMREERVQAAYDQIFCPIYVQDVVDAILSLQRVGAKGLFNLCGSEIWSRLNLAKKIAECLSVDEKLIESISLDDLKRTYNLPKRTDMRCDKFHKATNMQLTPLSSSLEYLREKYQNNV